MKGGERYGPLCGCRMPRGVVATAGVAVGVIGSAITLFEDGHIERAAHLLASLRRSAVDANDDERLGEIEDVVAQMRALLSGEEPESFDGVLSSGSLPTAAETITSKPFDPLKWATRLVLLALSLTIALDLIAVIS